MEYLDIRGGKEADGSDPQAVLGATLCMMSCSMQSGCRIYLVRIAENLEWLGALKSLDANFRRLCRRLAAHWEAEAAQSRDGAAGNVSMHLYNTPSNTSH